MALIMGVYEDLLAGIKSFDFAWAKRIFTGKWKEAMAMPPWVFLICLVTGIATAILLLSKIIKELYDQQPAFLFSFFFGLIVASVLVLARTVPWRLTRWLALAAGTAFGVLFVSLSPHQMSQDPLTLFLCGAVAIMAMILPGISGAFLLLILGQYAWVLSQLNELRDAMTQRDLSGVFGVVWHLMPLGLGAVVGLLLFARILSWLLARFHWGTLAVLIGFMVGSLTKIWPWREVTRTEVIGEKERILADRMVLPAVNADLFLALGLAVLGFVLIMSLEAVQAKRSGKAMLTR